MEQGRWAYKAAKFASGAKVMPPIMRREHQKVVAMSLNEGVGYRSNQGMIWNEIAMKSERMAAHSATGAMADLFEGQRDRLSEYLKAFRLAGCQVGALFAINGEVVGLECFGHQKTFEKFFPKLVESYALDALDWLDPSKGKKAPPESEVRNFVDGLQKTSIKSYPSLGLGENVRMEAPFISGAALVFEGQILHLSAFSHSGHKNDKIKVPFSRFSRGRKR